MRSNDEYFELKVPEFSTGERYFECETPSQFRWLVEAYELQNKSKTTELITLIQQMGPVDSTVPVHVSGSCGLFLHDSFYNFLKSLNMDELWNTYPVVLYEKDAKTKIPNYHHGLIVKQHVGFVRPPWTTPRTPDDPLYGAPGIGDLKGTWFNEAELKDDRLFCINQGPLTFRRDIKEQIVKAFPVGLSWRNLKDI